MKTLIPNLILDVETAEKFINDLVSNNEEFHPYDDANDILIDGRPAFSPEDAEKLNTAFAQISLLNNYNVCRSLEYAVKVKNGAGLNLKNEKNFVKNELLQIIEESKNDDHELTAVMIKKLIDRLKLLRINDF